MRKVSVGIILALLSGLSYAEQWARSGYITEKEWAQGSKIMAFGKFRDATGFDPKYHCDISEGDGVVEFDVSMFAEKAGSSFDVNRIYVDGIGSWGDWALDRWLSTWTNDRMEWLFDGFDWREHNVIGICVGVTARLLGGGFVSMPFNSIVLWYDGPVVTTGSNLPQDSGVGDKADMSKTADALAVADNGVRLRDLNGSGIKTRETEAPSAGKPDFIVDKVRLTTTGGTEQYVYNIGDQVQMKADLKNTGDDDIPGSSYVYTRFYLSKGLKEDSHNTWVRVGTDQTLGSNLDPGETHLEEEGLQLWNQDIVQPGKTYNVVVCTDRTADQSNGSGDWIEKHESNNCSTPAVFTVNGNFNFTASNTALGGGKTSLHAGETFSVNASVYNAGSDSPQEMRVGHFLSGGTMASEVLLGTKIVTEAEFVAGASKSVTLESLTAPTTPGTYILDVCMDYDERTQETNETDNCSSFSFAVSAAYDPSPKKANPAVFTILFND